jgi:carbon-monoxide dehydrogenase large subunit
MQALKPTPYIGASIERREDARLLTGQGRYIADLSLPNMVHAAFLRSPHAHASIRSINVEKAQALEGVLLVVTGKELLERLPPVQDQQLPLPKKWRAQIPHKISDPRQPLLAHDRVRHVGEALVAVVATSRYIAEDALDLIEVDYELLDAVTDPADALKPETVVIHEQIGTNLLAEFRTGKGDAAAALAQSPHRLKRRFYHHRYAGIPMECRGVLAQYEDITHSYTVWSSTQVPHWVRREIAQTLALSESQVRCIAPDVGGGFGTKGHVYPEDILVTALAKLAARPVRWIEDRAEHFQAACHSRDQWHDVEVGFNDQGQILAFVDAFMMDCGAWNPVGIGIPYNTACHLPGPYKIPHIDVQGRVIATNKVPNAPYRGAGRPEAAQVTERMMDLIARQLNLEPAEVRRRNMVQAHEMPYAVGMPYRDGEPIVYDSGDYPAALEKALDAMGGIAAFRKKQKDALAQGKYIGLGLCAYTEGTGVGPFEGATVRIDSMGKLQVIAGACAQGQGMETVYAQIAADLWQINMDDVSVKLGDTGAIAMGFGTIASRSTVNVSAAMFHATEALKKKVLSIAGNMLEATPEDLYLVKGGVAIKGVPEPQVSLGQVALAARPGWDHQRPPGVSAGLEETFYWEPPTVTWSNAVHLAEVAVDLQTGAVGIERYIVSHDCGRTINPMLADGQIIGGTAQGIGGAFYESINYDAQGQPMLGSFMDYLIPSANEIPNIEVIHQESPSPLNPVGVKGLGEGGAIGPPVALANAICDALAPFEIEFNETPITPSLIMERLTLARSRNDAAQTLA